jgi:hypothetical protein
MYIPLVIDRRYAGTGLGLKVLRSAEQHVGNGREMARLDCVGTNDQLRRYHRAAGYREVRERSFGATSKWSRPLCSRNSACSGGMMQVASRK